MENSANQVPEKFVAMVEAALRLVGQFRKNRDQEPLVNSDFARSSLVQACFFRDEDNSPEACVYGVQGVLQWAVDKLSPGGTHDFIARRWRLYNSLYYPYLAKDGLTFQELAKKMVLDEGTVFIARDQALQIVVERLHEELTEPHQLPSRMRYVVEERYSALPDKDQSVLHLVVIFRHPVSVHSLQQLATKHGVSNPAVVINRLTGSWLIKVQPTLITVHPDVHDYLLTCVPVDILPSLHTLAAEYCQEQYFYLEAAYHWHAAHSFAQAADIVINHHQVMIGKGQTQELQALLARFHALNLTPTVWVQLKIVAGDIAMLVNDIDTALDEYGYALSIEEATKYQQALAYYRRARAFELQNLWRECQLHYQKGMDLLKAEGKHQGLLVDMYIDRAWLYIQEKPDLDKAEADLKEAQLWLPANDNRRHALFHNAWIEICWKKPDTEQGFSHCLEAWLAATKTQDKSLMVMTGHNLGQAYIWRTEHETGLYYLQKTLDMAKEISDRQHEAKCYRAIAASYILQAEETKPEPDKAKFAIAISHLEQAYPLFLELNNVNWLGHVHHDLANAYAGKGDVALARQNYQAAVKIARNGNITGLLTELEQEGLLADLAQAVAYYPELATELDENHQLAVTTAKQEGEITNRRYQDLTGLARGTATLHLNELVDLGYLVKEGDGRSTRYLLKKQN